jgi:hypothetical protein
VIFEPLDFIARLAALVPKPRVNLTRFHGVFAPLCPLGATANTGCCAAHGRVSVTLTPGWSRAVTVAKEDFLMARITWVGFRGGGTAHGSLSLVN